MVKRCVATRQNKLFASLAPLSSLGPPFEKMLSYT